MLKASDRFWEVSSQAQTQPPTGPCADGCGLQLEAALVGLVGHAELVGLHGRQSQIAPQRCFLGGAGYGDPQEFKGSRRMIGVEVKQGPGGQGSLVPGLAHQHVVAAGDGCCLGSFAAMHDAEKADQLKVVGLLQQGIDKVNAGLGPVPELQRLNGTLVVRRSHP